MRLITIGTISRLTINLLITAIVARNSSPVEFGYIAIVLVIMNIAYLVSDFGFNSAYVSLPGASDDDRSTLLWFNICICLIIYFFLVIACLMLPLDQQLKLYIIIGMLVLPVNAGFLQIKINYEKNLYFKVPVLIEVISAICGLSVAIVLSLLEFGGLALVLSSIFTSTISLILYWLFALDGWRPKLELRVSVLKKYVHFGSRLILTNAINVINSQLDILLGSYFSAFDKIGLYGLAREINLKAQRVVNPVFNRFGFPLFSQIQSNQKLTRRIFSRQLGLVSTLNAGLFVFIFSFSDFLIYVYLGNGWNQATIYLEGLAFWGFLRAVGNPTGSLLMGVGRVDLAAKVNFVQFFILLMSISYAAAHHGLHAVATTMSIVYFVMLFIFWRYTVHVVLQLSLRKYLIAIFKPFVIACFAFLPFKLAGSQFLPMNIVIHVLLIIGSVGTYLYLTWQFNRFAYDQILRYINKRT